MLLGNVDNILLLNINFVRYNTMLINIHVCVILFSVFFGTQAHNAECPKMPIKCDSCGKKKIPRDKVFLYLAL